MGNCLFCKIIAGEIPSQKVYEDEKCYAFRDINPQAPVHILIAPKEHMANISECAEKGADLCGHLVCAAVKIAKSEGLENGFRIVTNNGSDACQSVEHLHVHLLGGKKLSEGMC